MHYTLAKKALFTVLLTAGGLLSTSTALAFSGKTTGSNPMPTARRVAMQAVCTTPTLSTNSDAFHGDYIIGSCAATDTLYYAFGSVPDLSDEDCARVTDGTGTPIAGGGNISVDGLSDGDVLYVVAWRNGNDPSAVATYTIQRYSTPTVQRHTSTHELRVTNGNSGYGTDNKVYYTTEGSPSLSSSHLDQNINTIDCSTLALGTTFHLRVFGDTKFPSAEVNYSASRFARPNIVGYIPYREAEGGVGAQDASGSVHSDPGSCIYINTTHFDSPGVLTDPDPFDASTYDVKVPTGSSISLQAAEFKMVAARCTPSEYGDNFTSLVNHITPAYTGYWAMSYTDGEGVSHYMSFDPDNLLLRTVTQFDNTCLWMRDNTYHDLYYTREGVRYYLTAQGLNVRATSTLPENQDWVLDGNHLLHVSHGGGGNTVRRVMYSDGQWMLTGLESGDRLEIRHDVQQASVASGSYPIVRSFTLDSIASTAEGTATDGFSNHPYRTWLAFDSENESYSLSVYPTLILETRSTPTHKRYYFVDDESRTHEYFVYANRAYTDVYAMPSVTSYVEELHPNANITYSWSVSGDAAPYFVTPDGTNNSHVLRRNGTVAAHPLEGTLQVTAHYDNNGLTADAETDPITLFAESVTTLTYRDNNGTQSAFDDGQLYLLANYGDNSYTLDLNGEAVAVGNVTRPSRVWRIRQTTYEAHTAYTLYNELEDKYLVAWNDTAYNTNRAAARLVSPGDLPNASDHLFVLTPHADDENGTSVTLQPYSLAYGRTPALPYSLAPTNGTLAADVAVRQLNSDRSWYQIWTADYNKHYSETQPSAYYLTRWQLQAPHLVPPVISMDPEGVVTLTSVSAGPIGLTYGTDYRITYQVNEGSSWGGWLTYDPANKPQLSRNHQLRARIEGLGDYSYLSHSANSEIFTALRVMEPVPVVNGNDISFTCDHAIGGTPIEGRVYYTVDGSEPDDGDILYTAPSDPMLSSYGIRCIGYADNCLKSEVVNFVHSAQLNLTVSTTQSDAPYTVTMVVDNNPGLIAGTHYKICYTLDGTTPTASSTEYDYANGLTIPGYAFIKAKAFPLDALDGHSYSTSTEQRLFVGEQLYVFSYVSNGGNANDTNAMQPTAEGEPVNSNVPHINMIWTGPRTAYVNSTTGDLFYNAYHDAFLAVEDEHYALVSTPVASHASLWIYGGTTGDNAHTLRTRVNGNNYYVVFDPSLSYPTNGGDWIATTTPNGSDYQKAVAYRMDTIRHAHSVVVTPEGEHTLQYDLLQPEAWDATVAGINADRYPMDGNWASLRSGDVFQFRVAIDVAIDEADCPEHLDCAIYRGAADDEVWQTWHYSFQTRQFYQRAEEFTTHTATHLTGVDEHTTVVWDNGSGNLGASGSLGSYFTYAVSGDQNETVTLTRNGTSTGSGPNFGTVLGVTVTFTPAGGAPINFGRKVGHIYAETSASVPTLNSVSGYKIQTHDGSQYLSLTPGSAVDYPEYNYLTGERIASLQSDYMSAATWDIKTTRNISDGVTVYRLHNLSNVYDSVLWHTLAEQSVNTKGTLYLYDRTSDEAHNWRIELGNPFAGYQATHFDFMLRTYAGGYYTVSPYCNTYGLEPTESPLSSQRLSLAAKTPAESAKHSHISTAYTLWGEGHNAAGPATFWKSRWTIAAATLTEPIISMTPDGTVTFSHRESATLGSHLKYYYTTDGSTPTTSSSLYNPAAKPVLTYGQTLKAIAHLDAAVPAAGYGEGSSPVETFTPTKCATPVFVIDGTSFTFTHTEGDTVVYSINNGEPHWNSPLGTSIYHYDGESVPVHTGDLFLAHAFRANCFESDLTSHSLATLWISPTYTPGVGTTTPPSVTLTAKYFAGGENHDAELGHYAIYWTTNDAADLSNIDPSNLPAGVNLYTGPVNTAEVFPMRTPLTFRAVAISAGSQTLYNTSDEYHQTVLWGYESTTTLANGSGTAGDPYQISTAGDLMTVVANPSYHASGLYFRVMNDLDITGCGIPSIAAPNFAGHWDGNYKVITGASQPLFDVVSGAHIYNVILDNPVIESTTNANGDCGAICNEANGTTVIWNSGVRNSKHNHGNMVKGTRYVGGLVGYLAGTARVVNCYNYAHVSSTNTAGGLVGYQATASTASSRGAIVFNCVNYGNVSATSVATVVNGNYSNNIGNTGINTYNYFRHGIALSGTRVYDASGEADPRFLTRWELYRYILNSNRDLCAWWITGSLSDTATVGKWMLDTAIAEYPIVKTWGFYHSPINPNYEAASTEANAYEGKKLGTLTVHLNRGGYGTGATSKDIVLTITDMDTLHHDYNYYKVQMPYYQDHFGYSSSEAKIVTGWDITSMVGGTTGTFSTSGDNAYNFADRNCTAKDIYATSGRVFAQGGYFNVPEGVTEITVTAHWANAIYLNERYYDYTYNNQYGTASPADYYGDRNGRTYHGQTVKKTLNDAMTALTDVSTVYDQAIVLVGNYRATGDVWGINFRPFTMMSVDEDNDHEPDYRISHAGDGRKSINPIRFDFVAFTGIGMASKLNNTASGPAALSLYMPKGHFEITETALAHFWQFEYDLHSSSAKRKEPLILQNGVFEQFFSSNTSNSDRTMYIHVGGHVWFKKFGQGCHYKQARMTTFCPVTATGGDYNEFYLSGAYPGSSYISGNVGHTYLFANGGHYKKYASGGQQQINGNTTVKADHVVAWEFYGGGTNAAINSGKNITGNIDVTINNSIVGIYAGGPQFGDMAAGKTVTTRATNTIFGTYYGAGYGGTSIYVLTKEEEPEPKDSWLPDSLAAYFPGRKITVESSPHITIGYGAEFIPYSNSTATKRVARYHKYLASLSKANTKGVTSTLTNCTVKNNYYGAGFVGVVTGNVTSTLTNTHIMGSAYGAGNSATAPKCQVYKTPAPAYYKAVKYDYWTGYYTFPLEEETPKEYTWVHVGSLTSPYLTTWEGDGEKTIKTPKTLDDLGQVTGNVTLTIEGNSVIDGSVCGGGDEAPMTGNTVVTIKDNTRVRDRVFGGGNLAAVNYPGSSSVTIGENGQSGSTHRPYIGHTVYGGGNAADLGGNATVNIYEGIMGSVYGGGNKGSVTGNSTVNVQGGFIGYTIGKDNGVESFSVAPEPIHPATGRDRAFCGVYGGGFGVGTTVTGTATVTIGAASSMNGDVKVYGSVYGGGEAGQVGGGYKDAHLATGALLSSDYYYFDFGTGKFARTTSGTAVEGVDYYTYVAPTFDRTTTSVTLLSDGVKTVDIAGAVYGGGRGYYYILNEEGVLDGTEVSFQRPIAGAVYGNTSVTSGTVGQDTNWLHVGSLTYTAEFDIAEEYKVLDPDLKSSGAVFWEQNLYVYDLDNLNFKEITPDLVAVRVRARAKNGGEKIVNISAGDYDEDLQYYISFGRVSMAGGGERGPVFGSTAFGANNLLLADGREKYNGNATGGNCTVTVHSGKIGDVQYHEQRVEGVVKNVGEVYGDIFGGGLMADVYGVTRIVFDGPTAWCLGDVYGGGNMGAVYASSRASESATTTAIQVDFQKGWARNVHSGNQLADLGAGCNGILNIGVPAYVGIADNDARHEETLISESCYGGCGFSPSKGNTTVTMYSGCVGYVRSGYPINTAGYGEAGDEMTEGSKGDVVPNNQDLLSYEGNVYGSGFGPLAEVLTSHVIIHGGRIRNGVFGGGELAAVIDRSEDLPVSTFHYRHLLEEGALDEADITYKPGAANLMRSNVEVFGGTMSMVCGGGRGYTSFLKVLAQTPGAIMGNARVYIAGGTVDSVHYPAALGGGCVYGGGLEGIVTGNCYVHVVKGTVKNRVFGGGRGFSGALTGEHADPEEDVANRSTTDAGSVKGNVYVTIKDTTISATTYTPTICGGVYGGGEGSVYYGSRGHYIDKDTVAIVEGNVIVNISAGTIGGGHTETNMSAHGSFAGGRIAPVHGYANIHVFGTTDIAGVFGGNDITGYVSGKNRPATSTHLSTYAGASGITRDTASTYVRIDGSATVGRVFGGGNGDYNYYGDPVYDYLHLSKPVQPSSYVDIDMNRTTMSAGKPATSFVSQAYGGGNAASVDTAHVYIFGKGLVDTVFGGGNAATVYEKAIIHCNADPDLAGAGNENNINYLFGGNNQATMSILPDVYLNSGMLYNVYGGGNAGAMIGEEARRDIFNKVVSPLSTYLIVNSNRITVRGSLYGGCNQARVLNGAYVDVRNTTTSGTPYGIENLYGGNDISDTVIWTRVDINGGVVHNLYGGGNGHYNYTAQGYRYIVTPYGDDNVEHAIAARTNGRPYVDTTFLNIQGGTINSNIYGGGWAGNCGTTRTVVNDTVNYSLATDHGTYLEITSGPTAGQRYGYANVSGKIFGGGEGLLERVRDHGTHVGNVSRKAITDLKHVTVLGEAYVYAGGNAGDVQDAVLTVHSEWNQKLSALYGGCYGSDVLGTSRVYMNCDTIAGTDQYNVRMLYGGNDFTGTVKKSILTVNNGKYFNVYGAGNGDYPAGDYGAYYSLPNSEEPTVTFNNGYVDNNLYGGGDMGLCYKGDTTTSYPTADDYAHVVVNVHNGHFRNHIYCGAHGASNGRQLVYGLKQLNMDGGDVRWSIYGGSENVHDGYPNECIAANNTTQRPSTILNIVGGQVQNRLYGGGYLGNIYGSVYVNVGKDAVNDSPVWTNTYNGTATAYADYKPVFVSTLADDTAGYLMPHDTYLLNSIYNGSDWGEAHGVYIFNVPGFYGGESRILIDGHGYNTSASSSGSSLPFMDIAGSLMGSGTSTEGGDVHRNITLRNYGNWACPNPSKELNTIQRADEVLLDSVFIALAGYQDGYSAYVSPNYSLCRIDDLIMRDRNVVMLNAPSVYIGQMQFQHPDGTLVESSDDKLALKNLEVDPMLVGNYPEGECDTARYHIKPCDSIDFCERISSNLTNNPYTNLIVDDGVYVDVLPFIDDGTGQQSTSAGYGPVLGYARLLSNDDYQAYFTARHKVDNESNTTDGGFFSGCVCENSHGSDHELEYKNYGTNFRVWTTGNGQFRRSRHISIVAHANVDYDKRELSYNQRVYRTSTTSGLWYNPSLINVENAEVFRNSPAEGYIQVDTSRISGDIANGLSDFAISTGSIDLPPSSAGHYYTISSVEIDEENGGEMRLITATWDTTGGNPDWYYMTGATEHDGSAIRLDPNFTFGLMFHSGENFSGICPINGNMPSMDAGNCFLKTVISGNANLTTIGGYHSDRVGNLNNVSPKLDVTLTYSTKFSQTLTRDVVFTLYEYDENGHLISPIDMVVTISTVIKDFIDNEETVLAMYNDGFTNEYSRKLVLPASLTRRTLYLKAVKWEPTTDNADYFHLTTAGALPADNVHFGLTLNPEEDITNNQTSNAGWTEINVNPAAVDIFSIVQSATNTDMTGLVPSGSTIGVLDKMGATVTDGWVPFTENGGDGLCLGTLDGRYAAALNVRLIFDGMMHYPKDAVIGKVYLKFYYTSGVDDGYMTTLVNVKTRPKGDTIYMASANSITRNGVTLHPFNWNGLTLDPTILPTKEQDGIGATPIGTGKSPGRYVQTFAQALHSNVYQDGDVIAIMDSVVMTDEENYTLRGTDYSLVRFIRYTGTHWQMPGKAGAYRGPLIVLRDNSQFVCYNTHFDGGGLTKVKQGNATLPARCPSYLNGSSTPIDIVDNATIPSTIDCLLAADGLYYDTLGSSSKDTICAHGPIFMVLDESKVVLNNKVTIANNFNAATGTGGDTLLGGAIRIRGTNSKTPDVTLLNNVTIEKNVVNRAAAMTNHKSTGAVHMHQGKLELGSSHESTAVDITRNYYYTFGSSPAPYTDASASGTKYIFDPEHMASKSNVYLTRTPASLPGDPVVNDAISDFISYKYKLPASTRISVNKWFPGRNAHVRDTIEIANVTVAKQLWAQYAISNGNFLNDSVDVTNENVFYHATLSPYRIYLQRCSTFQKQLYTEDGGGNPTNVLYTTPSGNVYHRAALEYRASTFSECPDGVDTLIFNVCSGFYPYTFKWERNNATLPATDWHTFRTYTTPYAEDQVLADNTYTKAVVSNSDTTLAYGMVMDKGTTDLYNHYRVTATNLLGCELTKEVEIACRLSTEVSTGITYSSEPNEAFTDTLASHHAKATRNYKGYTTSLVVQPAGESWGTAAAYWDYEEDPLTTIDLEHTVFCPGQRFDLHATPATGYKFLMWDFDPYDNQSTRYIKPNINDQIYAYFGPEAYWKDHVTTAPATTSYRTDYNGDVHIFDEEGLAWLISVVNGLNDQQIRSFYFDTVYLHDAAHGGKDEYNMVSYLWTPVGTKTYKFRGHFLADDDVIIKGIIVDEPQMECAGLFSYLDSAVIDKVKMQRSILHGRQYVGGLAGKATHTKITDCQVMDHNPAGSIMSNITTNYASGGLLGKAEDCEMTGITTGAKYMGSAIYSGGIIGLGNNVKIYGTQGRYIPRMSAIYSGGTAGYVTGTADTSVTAAKNAIHSSHLANNYARIDNQGSAQYVGGLVGYAQNTLLENNYVYGSTTNKEQPTSGSLSGAIGAELSDGVTTRNCYYAEGTNPQAIGYNNPGNPTNDTATFHGSGNNVRMSQPAYGTDNLVLALNKWVRQHPNQGFSLWRSDIADENQGYPVFGTPDIIPIYDTVTGRSCDYYEFNGTQYYESGVYDQHVVDSTEMVDSTYILVLTIDSSMTTTLLDTIEPGVDYEDYGFYLTAAEIDLLRRTAQEEGSATIVVTDTLQTIHGCDSIVTLYLTFHSEGIAPTAAIHLQVYPNPTTHHVTVEATGMREVEVYDAVSRRVARRRVESDQCLIDLSGCAAGTYYLRVHTTAGTVIQKVIKR